MLIWMPGHKAMLIWMPGHKGTPAIKEPIIW